MRRPNLPTVHEFDHVGSTHRRPHREDQYAWNVGEAIISIESLKVRVLEWPGLTETARAEFFRTLDGLRGAFVQAMQVRSEPAPAPSAAQESVFSRPGPRDLRLEGIIGQSPAIQKILRILSKVASTDLTVLMEGETGVGKELFARIIHANSGRSNLVAVNCGAFPATLIESELFGHVKGAFTGATSNRKGKFEEADGGTIFLDEIGELDLSAQVKLLRVLETGELQRIGSDSLSATDVRVIAATNRNLRQMVEERQFREDLYYRLNICPLFIPPLRERRDEIPILLEYFFQEIVAAGGRRRPRLDIDLTHFLFDSYEYPGNIRELKNLSRYLAQMGGEAPVGISDLPESYFDHADFGVPRSVEGGSILPLEIARGVAERSKLVTALQKRRGHIPTVCKDLAISRSRLYQLLQKHGVAPSDFRG